jgi:VWFA-related protein
VTDKSGKAVTDLRPEEVEILEDGRSQKVTNFSFVSPDVRETTRQPLAAQPTTTDKVAAADKTTPPLPPIRLRPEQVRRTIALVVDDLGLSFESTARVRKALRTFVDQQMQPGDLVAIVRTSAGVGALQQFTSDKQQLNAAIERVRWYPIGRGGVSAFAALESDLNADALQSTESGLANLGRKSAAVAETNEEEQEQLRLEQNQIREELFAVGTLGAVSFIIRGLSSLPGRKSVLLFSDGLRLFTRVRNNNLSRSANDDAAGIKGTAPGAQQNVRIVEALQRLTDQANRSSVVIYTMDARGLSTLGLTAEDNVNRSSPQQIEQSLFDRKQEYFDTQSGLEYMARLTGGLAIRDANDLDKGVRRILDDQSSYYLIGYRPDEATFDPSTGRRIFHHLTVKVKRSGLSARWRSGFYGVTDEEARPAQRLTGDSLLAALASPFNAGSLHLRLTSLFGHDKRAGSIVYSMLLIDGRDLSFKAEPDGWQTAVINVAAYTFGDSGNVIDSFNDTHTIRARGETYDSIMRDGLLYTLNVPVKKAGAYQLRVAVRDATSKRVGSASQFIEVPNLNKNRLTLSGLVVEGLDPSRKAANQSAPAAVNTPEAIENEVEPQASPAVRRLRKGMTLRYIYTIFNAQPDRATGRPQLQTQVRLFRDSRELYRGKPAPYDMGEQRDSKHLRAGGRIELSRDAAPGEYVLQVIVTDTLAKENRTATQWIDFEIVK